MRREATDSSTSSLSLQAATMSPAADSSHVVEGDPSSWKTSYVENAANIFNKDVPVCVKGESTEKIEELTVRILMGLNKQKQSKASDNNTRNGNTRQRGLTSAGVPQLILPSMCYLAR